MSIPEFHWTISTGQKASEAQERRFLSWFEISSKLIKQNVEHIYKGWLYRKQEELRMVNI